MSWHDDGHRLYAVASGDDVILNVVCPGEDACECPVPCLDCAANEDGICESEPPCSCERCGGTCAEPNGGCNIVEWIGCTGWQDAMAHDGDDEPIHDGMRIKWRWEDGYLWRAA